MVRVDRVANVVDEETTGQPVTTDLALDAEDHAAQALFAQLCGDFYRAVVEWNVSLYATTPGGDGAGDDSQEALPDDRYDKFAA